MGGALAAHFFRLIDSPLLERTSPVLFVAAWEEV